MCECTNSREIYIGSLHVEMDSTGIDVVVEMKIQALCTKRVGWILVEVD